VSLAVANGGWPTLGSMAGKIVCVLTGDDNRKEECTSCEPRASRCHQESSSSVSLMPPFSDARTNPWLRLCFADIDYEQLATFNYDRVFLNLNLGITFAGIVTGNTDGWKDVAYVRAVCKPVSADARLPAHHHAASPLRASARTART